jgi:uncharacterized protein (DUF2141 family)
MTHARNALLFATITIAASSVPHAAHAGNTATIVLEVSTFRNTHGFLGCQLYPKGEDFPDNWSAHRDMRKRVPVTGPTTSCTFPDMPPGTYGAAVIHDENGNGKLDKNFLGMPLEGYGISNNHTHALSRPTWNESKFAVAADTTYTSRISIRY